MKKLISIIVAVAVALAFPVIAYAEYTDTVPAFEYNGYSIPAYNGSLSVVINGNEPRFTAEELNQTIYEKYGELDALGRVTACSANIDQSLMPVQPRGDISYIYPTGWKQNKYDFIEGGSLYNRSHLIARMLTGEDANPNNLMTGTRSFNSQGMLAYENIVCDYVKAAPTNNALYRVTPVFIGDNLLASGVIIEAESVDDSGAAVKFCVFVYNVERGVSIDYSTGDNKKSGEAIDISSADIKLASLYVAYTGEPLEPLEYVKVNNRKLIKDVDYIVSYENNINPGEAKVTVTGINNYKGTASKMFTIKAPQIPAVVLKKPKTGKKKMTVYFNKNNGVDFYRLEYATNKKFKKAKKVKIKGTASSKQIKKLISGKKYYVRIKAYKKIGSKKYCSNWSAVKSVKIK